MAGTQHTQQYRSLIATLIAARKAAGLSQAALATLIGRPPSFVAKAELCERRLDVVEFWIFASTLCDDPMELFKETLEALPKKIPR